MDEEITEQNSSLEYIFGKRLFNDKPLTYKKTLPDIDIKKSLQHFSCDPTFFEYNLRDLIRYYLFLNRKKHRDLLVQFSKALFEAEREN